MRWRRGQGGGCSTLSSANDRGRHHFDEDVKGRMDSIPYQGTKIPHPAEQLSLQASATEPACHNHNEDPVCCNEGLMQTNKSTNKINIF